MDPELAQVEGYESAVGPRSHADGAARVQHEERGPSGPI